MPQVQPLASQALVRAEVQRASTRTAVDFNYLLGQARLESSLDPSARAPNSSARGLFQFISSTWLDTLQKHGPKHGLEWATAQIEQTRAGPTVRDPAMREQILALRYDPQIASLMAGEFASDNRDTLRGAIGREPNGTDLYLAHFLGPAGATDFLRSLGSDPGQSAALLFPKAASANRSTFYDADSGARSLSQVYGLLDARLANAIARNDGAPSGFAMDDITSAPGWLPMQPESPVDRKVVQRSSADAVQRPSMAETLRANFALDSGSAGSANNNARRAYGILQAFKL